MIKENKSKAPVIVKSLIRRCTFSGCFVKLMLQIKKRENKKNV